MWIHSVTQVAPRHKDVGLLQFEEISERRFAQWSTAFVDLSDRDPMIMMGHPEFDPYSASGAMVMTLVGERVAAGHDIKLPVASDASLQLLK